MSVEIKESTEIKAVLFGGPLDGAMAFIPFAQQTIKVGENKSVTYSDSFYMDDEGNAIFYCSRGGGRLKLSYVNKLFKDKDCLG